MFHGSTSIVIIAVAVAARFGLGRGLKAVRRPRRREPQPRAAGAPPGALRRARAGPNRQARTATVMLPLLLLVLFLGMWGVDRVGPAHVEAATYYVPGLVALSVIASSFVNLVISVVTQRETGVLKRRPATPVPAWALIGGRAATAMAVSLAMATALIALHRPYSPAARGFGIAWVDLAVLALWAAAGLAVALRRFSWVPGATA